MIELTELTKYVPYILAGAFALYIIILLKKHSDNNSENAKLEQVEKLAEYFSSSEALEPAMRQLVQEEPASTTHFQKVISRIDEGKTVEDALSQASNEISDEFFSKICHMLIFANRENDAKLLYNSVQKMKEAYNLSRNAGKSADIGSWTIQFVFSIVIPLIYFFMISTLGFESDVYLNYFLGMIAVAPALFQGVVYRQWAESLVKVPLLFSAFYLLYFVIAPKFFSQLLGSF